MNVQKEAGSSALTRSKMGYTICFLGEHGAGGIAAHVAALVCIRVVVDARSHRSDGNTSLIGLSLKILGSSSTLLISMNAIQVQCTIATHV